MKRQYFMIIMLLLFALTILIGCEKKSSDLPVQTIKWKEDGSGFIRYYTNDDYYKSKLAYSWNNSLTESPMDTVEISARKISGGTGGYGVVFCFQDTDNFYVLLISTLGNYTVNKKINGAFLSNPLRNWTPSAYINQGYNQLNVIRVQRNSTTGAFTFSFNGNTVASTLTDPADPFTGGKYGFAISISDKENFPNEPVDVRFKMNTPTPPIEGASLNINTFDNTPY